MAKQSISELEPFDEKQGQWRVVIETPKGSHNKYKFDPDLGVFMLNGVLPEGMSFPYDFGFLPATVGEDGDPLDVLLLMDEPAFCGCLVPSRLIGVIEAEQTETDGKTERNDRLVAVPVKCRVYSDCKSLKDLNEHRVERDPGVLRLLQPGPRQGVQGARPARPRQGRGLVRDGIKKAAKSGK